MKRFLFVVAASLIGAPASWACDALPLCHQGVAVQSFANVQQFAVQSYVPQVAVQQFVQPLAVQSYAVQAFAVPQAVVVQQVHVQRVRVQQIRQPRQVIRTRSVIRN